MIRSFIVLLMLFVAAPAFARAPTEAEQAGLSQSVSALEQAIRTNDYDAMVSGIPPKMMAEIARGANVTPEQIRQGFAQAMAATMASVTIESYAMNVAGAQMGAGKDGASYALIPTVTVLKMKTGGRVEARSSTLAIFDSGAWWLLRLQGPEQMGVFRRVYPNFADVVVPVGETRALEDK